MPNEKIPPDKRSNERRDQLPGEHMIRAICPLPEIPIAGQHRQTNDGEVLLDFKCADSTEHPRIRQTPLHVQNVRRAEAIEPVLETLEGWCSDTTAIQHWEELPVAARRYLDRIGEIIGTETVLAGVGPERTQSLVRPGSWLARDLGL